MHVYDLTTDRFHLFLAIVKNWLASNNYFDLNLRCVLDSGPSGWEFRYSTKFYIKRLYPEIQPRTIKTEEVPPSHAFITSPENL